MKDIIVPLIRRFVPAKPLLGDWEFLHPEPSGSVQGWRELEEHYRVLVLADPGAGKTFEAKDRATKLREKGAKAFFIRIEAIDAAFDEAFEVGSAAEFAEWLAGDGEAFFFLDSVDEAHLGTPRALEDAIRVFGACIQIARERARIIITSREDAWQALSDRTLVEQYLPHGAPIEARDDAQKDSNEADSDGVLKIYRLGGLKVDQIKLFAAHHGVDVNAFVAAIERGNLMTLAERPFDLKALIRKWQADGALGSRLEVLQRLVELQLAPLSSTAASPKIDTARARNGAQALAAAVTLTGRSIVSLPCDTNKEDRVDPAIQKLADALNRIQPEQLDKWLQTAGKIAVTVGALAVANKARHGVLGVMDFFGMGKKGGTSSALGALAANGRPVPVYVVNGGALGAAGLADGMDMFGGGKSGKFGKVGRFLARHRGLAKAVQYGSKALKYGGKALGVAGMAYSAYELTQAQNGSQLGGSLGSIAGGLIGTIGGPLGMVAGAYIGNYLGEKIGGWFDRMPEENAKALESERALNVLKTQSDTKIHLDINSPGADVTLRKIEDNSPENNMTRIDMSLGGRSYAY